MKTPRTVAASVMADNLSCMVVTNFTPSLWANSNCFQRKTLIAIVTAIQRKIPRGLPSTASPAARPPIIAGIVEPKIASPIAANGPINPVLIPVTVSLAATPSFSSSARSIPVTKVWKKLDVLKNCVCVRIISFNSGVPSPYILRNCGKII